MSGLVRLTSASSSVEAEMIEQLLASEGIHVLIQRPPGFDVPGFLSGGPRVLFVREDDLARAQEVVESHFGLA